MTTHETCKSNVCPAKEICWKSSVVYMATCTLCKDGSQRSRTLTWQRMRSIQAKLIRCEGRETLAHAACMVAGHGLCTCTAAVRPTRHHGHRSFCVSSGLVCQRPLDESHVLLKLVALTCLKVAQAWWSWMLSVWVYYMSRLLFAQAALGDGRTKDAVGVVVPAAPWIFDKLTAANRCLNEGVLTSFPVQSSYIFGTPAEAVDTQCIPLHYKPVMAAACLRAHAAGMTVVRYTIHIAKEKRKPNLKTKQKPPLDKTSDRRIGLLNARVDRRASSCGLSVLHATFDPRSGWSPRWISLAFALNPRRGFPYIVTTCQNNDVVSFVLWLHNAHLGRSHSRSSTSSHNYRSSYLLQIFMDATLTALNHEWYLFHVRKSRSLEKEPFGESSVDRPFKASCRSPFSMLGCQGNLAHALSSQSPAQRWVHRHDCQMLARSSTGALVSNIERIINISSWRPLCEETWRKACKCDVLPPEACAQLRRSQITHQGGHRNKDVLSGI